MGAGPEAEARSIRDIGNIRAEEAQQKGAIRANLAQGLGQTVNEGYTAYRDDKADKMWAGFLAKIAAPSDFDRGQEGLFFPDTKVPGLSAPPLTPRTITDETYEVPLAETPETGEEFFMPEGRNILTQTLEGPTGTGTEADPVLSPDQFVGPRQALPPDQLGDTPSVMKKIRFRGPSQSEGVLGDMTGADKKPYEPYRGQFFRNVTDHGLHDIESLRAEAVRAGMSGDQIARKIAESTEHNKGVTAFTTQNRAFKMSDLKIRQEGLLATILGNNPRPTNELRATLVRAFGPTKGSEDFKTYADGWKALTDLQSGNFENMEEKLNLLVGLLELSDSPDTRQQAYDQIIGVLEGAGIEVPQEIKEMRADPEALRDVFTRAFSEEQLTTTFAAQELKLEHAVDNARTPEEKKVAEDILARFHQRDTARHTRGRAPLDEGREPRPYATVVEMWVDAQEEYDDTIAEIEEAEVTGIFFGEYSFDKTDYSKDEAQRRRKVATDRLERVKQRLAPWMPADFSEDAADKWHPPLVAPDQEGVPTVSSGLRNSAGLYLPSRGVNP
jgi:hypothetical protein